MKEQISALLDGALIDGHEKAALDALTVESPLRDEWRTYCLIGDCLRGEAPVGRDITASVMASLENEPTVLAPHTVSREKAQSGWHARMLPIAAAITGVAIVGGISLYSESSNVAPVALATKSPLPRHFNSADDRDESRVYLLAHHGYAGSQAVPGVGYYIRTVSDRAEESGR